MLVIADASLRRSKVSVRNINKNFFAFKKQQKKLSDNNPDGSYTIKQSKENLPYKTRFFKKFSLKLNRRKGSDDEEESKMTIRN